MDRADRMRRALQQCEQELRESAADALHHGDYPSARTAMTLAEGVAEQRSRAGLNGPHGDGRDGQASAKQSISSSGKVQQPSAATGSTSPATTHGYPRFVRSGERLVKVGWSKRSKREYRHKAPRAAVFAFADHLRRHTRDGRIFAVDAVSPVPDTQNNGDLPAYQLYLALAWFRHLGIARKHGRDGYTIDHKDLIDEHLSQKWTALPSEEV